MEKLYKVKIIYSGEQQFSKNRKKNIHDADILQLSHLKDIGQSKYFQICTMIQVYIIQGIGFLI